MAYQLRRNAVYHSLIHSTTQVLTMPGIDILYSIKYKILGLYTPVATICQHGVCYDCLTLKDGVCTLYACHLQRNHVIIIKSLFIGKECIGKLYLYTTYNFTLGNIDLVGGQGIVGGGHRGNRSVTSFEIEVFAKRFIYLSINNYILAVGITTTPSCFNGYFVLIIQRVIEEFVFSQFNGTQTILIGKIYSLIIEVGEFIVRAFARGERQE